MVTQRFQQESLNKSYQRKQRLSRFPATDECFLHTSWWLQSYYRLEKDPGEPAGSQEMAPSERLEGLLIYLHIA